MPKFDRPCGNKDPAFKNNSMILFVTCLGTMMAAISNSSVNLANPTLAGIFAVDINRIQWVVTVYLMVICSVMLLLGRIGDRIGRHKVYLCGFIVFCAGSLFCGLSGSLGALLAARVIQAFGAAMIFAVGMGIVAAAFPASRRGKALGLNAVAIGLGNMCGPSVGGFILSRFSWHYIFYSNIPVGLVGLLFGLKFLRSPEPEEKETPESLDFSGALLFAVIVSSLILAISYNALFLSAAALAMPFFIRHERRHPAPLWDIGLLKNRRFSVGSLIAFFSYFTHFGLYFLMPFLLTGILRMSTSEVAMALMVAPVCMAVTSPVFGAVSDKTGALRVMPFAFLVILAGQIALALIHPDSPSLLAVAGLILLGSGLGMLNSPNNSEIMTAAGVRAAGYAGGFVSTTRYVANCFGTAAAAVAFTFLRDRFERELEAAVAFTSAFKCIAVAACCITCANLIVCICLRRSVK